MYHFQAATLKPVHNLLSVLFSVFLETCPRWDLCQALGPTVTTEIRGQLPRPQTSIQIGHVT